MLLGDYKRFQGRQVGFLEMVRDDLRIARVVGGRMLNAQNVRRGPRSLAGLFVCQLNLIPVLRGGRQFRSDSEAARYSTVP